MQNILDIIIYESTLLKEALNVLNKSSKQICIVLDSNNKLLGTLNDGDIRRAILDGKTLDTNIKSIYFKKPIVAHVNSTKEEIINLCTIKKIYQIPIVDDYYKVVGIKILDELLKPQEYKNKVILMVGGLGTRLKPLTDNTPKPMLPVGGKPILQTIVEKFVSYGFVNITMCIGYKSHIIQDFFEDGSKFGANIEYILEDKRMGTAGALSLLRATQKPKEPFFVMNGDLLTNVNFENMLDFHIQNSSKATMCVREYDFQVPYGVINIENEKVISIDEKPIHKFFVSAGIYMLNASCIDMIPKDEFYDMPTLFEKMMKNDESILSFPIREYWLDIGRVEEYEKANLDYKKVF